MDLCPQAFSFNKIRKKNMFTQLNPGYIKVAFNRVFILRACLSDVERYNISYFTCFKRKCQLARLIYDPGS